MSFDSTPITVRIPLPHEVVAGVESVLRAPCYRDGQLVPAVSVVAVLRDRSGGPVHTGGTVADGVAILTVPDPPLERRDDYYVDWTITTGVGVVRARQTAIVVRTPLQPVITDEDLYRRHPDLDAESASRLTIEQSMQDYVDEAWVELMHRVIAAGNRPNLIVTASALREPHLYLSLAIVFGALSSGQGEDSPMGERETKYRDLYENSIRRVKWAYDANDDGAVGKTKRPMERQVWMAGR